MEEETSVTLPCMQKCLICNHAAEGVNFGIDACRACAAFFRRSIVEKKQYHCKTGGKCPIRSNIRNLCRKCRLQKCFDYGMKIENVQGKRDPIKQSETPPNIIPETESPADSNQTTWTVSQPTTSQPVVFSQLRQPALLLKCLGNYRHLSEIRKAIELALDPTISKEMVPIGPLEGYAPANVRRLAKIFKGQFHPLNDYMEASYEEYSLLNSEEKWTLLRPFLVIFCWMDSGYQTYKKIPKEYYHRICLTSETTYFDLEHSDTFSANMGDDDSEDFKSGLINVFQKIMEPKNVKSLFMLHDMRMRDEEFMGFLGLCFWNNCTENQTENMKHQIHRVRSAIFEDLHAFHRLNDETFPATRLGELMDLYNVAMMEMMRCRENFELYTIMDAIKEDDYFYNLVKSVKI